MPARSLDLVRKGLISVKYRQERLKLDVPVPEDPARKIALVAYSDQPFDARTSAVAAVEGELDEVGLMKLRPVGAPIVAQCLPDHVLFWKQTPGAPKFLERVSVGKIASFFQKHQDELSPDAVYRAKVWGRMDEAWQSDFVDVGLLPVVEQAAGESLRGLLERAVKATKSSLGWGREMSDADGGWLLKSVFWLLAAKILKDKGVPGFVRGDLRELEDVYLKLAKHYDKHDPRPVQIDGSRRRDALLAAAEMIQSFGHCGAVTTESLAWVYESALIDRATRQKLGTHSTPTWMVDDIVAKLRPWIEAMPVDERRVCEPACGHAGFLISAMRLLSELLPEDRAGERKAYLRKRLNGIEIDPFAYEVARLSLTLADVPNDNGWMLDNEDMFSGDILSAAVSKATIVLANPPFERFGDLRPAGAMHSRADETFRQIVDALPVGGVFGIVMPQGILHSTQGKALRKKLLNEYEISEITLFADKVFNYGEPETAVILGRRIGDGKKSGMVRYRRVREEQIEAYKKTLVPSSLVILPTSVFEAQAGSLFVPQLADVWRSMENKPTLGRFVTGGQGLSHKGADDPTLPSGSVVESDVPIEGHPKGFAGWDENQLTQELPKATWLDLNPRTISRPRHGTVAGKAQILLNYGPARGAWRLKGLIDLKGHPVTSRFLVFRAVTNNVSLKAAWALCNSPVANAYSYSHSSKREILSGDMLEMRVFPLDSGPFEKLEEAVAAYFQAVKGSSSIPRKAAPRAKTPESQLPLGLNADDRSPVTAEAELKYLHWRIDAEVLRLYELPATTERRILELFTGVQRRGVPFVQTEYFPKGFTNLNRLSDLLAITADWAKTNRRRCNLIRKDVEKGLSEKEHKELEWLESLADARIAYMDILEPPVPDEIERTVERLKRDGKWPE